MGAKHTQRFALARFLLLSGGTGHCAGEAPRAYCCYPDSEPPRGADGALRASCCYQGRERCWRGGTARAAAGALGALGAAAGVAGPGVRPRARFLLLSAEAPRGGITGCCYHPYGAVAESSDLG